MSLTHMQTQVKVPETLTMAFYAKLLILRENKKTLKTANRTQETIVLAPDDAECLRSAFSPIVEAAATFSQLTV